MWKNEEFKKIIDYMSMNNFIIVPGTYKINQVWELEDGLFKFGDGEKHEGFKFQNK